MRQWLARLLGRRFQSGQGAAVDDELDVENAENPGPATAGEGPEGPSGNGSGPDDTVAGPGMSGRYIGRVAGDDSGYAEQTGAEQRAQERSEHRPAPPQGPA